MLDLDEQITRCRKEWRKAGGKFAAGSTAEFFRELLATHSVVMVGGNAYVATWRQSLLPGNSEVLNLIKVQAFGIYYGNRMWFGSDGRGQLKAIPISKPFAGMAKRYPALAYAPGESSEVNGALNLWRGFGVEALPGSWTLMQAHILDVLADGDEAVARYIVCWAAWAVQNPGNQAEVALVFKGGKGVGKGMFGRSMARLFGAHGLQIADQKHLVGQFNLHLANCSLLFADEAFGVRDKSALGALKRLITEPTLTIEPKGVDLFSVRNSLHVIMASNDDWIVPAGHDERRYAVTSVSARHRGDIAYFDALNRELENGGLEAMLHDLLTMDLGTWHPRNDVPQTAALQQQKLESLEGIDKVIAELAHEGCIPYHVVGRPDVAATSGEQHGVGFWPCCKRISPDLRSSNARSLMPKLREWGCSDFKSGNVRGVQFPPLQKLRAAFDQKYGAQSWNDAEDWHGPED